MATVPGPLIWEIVKKNNSFLVKEFGNNTQSVQFSRESNNLYNLNSYKFSGMIPFLRCFYGYFLIGFLCFDNGFMIFFLLLLRLFCWFLIVFFMFLIIGIWKKINLLHLTMIGVKYIRFDCWSISFADFGFSEFVRLFFYLVRVVKEKTDFFFVSFILL